MTNNRFLAPALAFIADANYYRTDITDRASLAEYIADIYHDADPTLSLRDQLATALDDDIRDLLHNRNESELLPFLDDDESLADAFIDAYADDFADDFIYALADKIIARTA